ncbi:sperm flagellar protein 1 [Aplochiton taeniatus]
MDNDLDEDKLQELYAWIDKIPLSRPKRNITRDFSDGVMAAEVVKHFFPKLVEMHNYSPANSTQQKQSNWGTLNRKVFSKLNFHVTEETVKRIVLSAPGVIEPVLCTLRDRIDEKRLQRSGDAQLDLEYYNTRNQEKVSAALVFSRHSPQATGELGPQVDPAVRLLLEEKEQALLALRETVEILQIKVNRLEHLVHLKDTRIEDLTRHMERYKARANMP